MAIAENTMFSPFSKLKNIRFPGWSIALDIETDGVQDISLFPNTNFLFSIFESDDMGVTSVYEITFLGTTVVSENNNNTGPTSNPALFKMGGAYNTEGKTFSFNAHPDAIIAEGSTFWLFVKPTNAAAGLDLFFTRSNVNAGIQYPFQFTATGANSGVLKIEHLVKPRRLNIKCPYLDQRFFDTAAGEDKLIFNEHLLGDGGAVPWQEGVHSIFANQEIPNTGARVSANIRASQPFLLSKEWEFASSADGVSIDDLITEVIMIDIHEGWAVTDARADDEFADYVTGASVNTLPPDFGGSVVHLPGLGADHGDNTNVEYNATIPELTLFRVQMTMTDLDGLGTGTIDYTATNPSPPPDTIPLVNQVFDQYVASGVNKTQDDFGFTAWQEL